MNKNFYATENGYTTLNPENIDAEEYIWTCSTANASACMAKQGQLMDELLTL